MDPALEKRLKRQIIGKTHRFLAVAPLGFEQTLVSEFKAIGIETASEPTHSAEDFRIVGDGKVEFTAKIAEAWKAVAYSRIANRVLMHIAEFKAENFRDFEKKASEIPWELFLDRNAAQSETRSNTAATVIQSNAIYETRGFSPLVELGSKEQDPVKFTNALNIHVSCKHSRLYHSDAIAERLYKTIEGFSATTLQNLYVNFLDDRCTIWLDLAGEELYRRGHERFVNDAPLKETIASAMIFEAIDTVSPREITLIDPMSGSGTFSLEAAYTANKLIPGVCRDFALKHQPAFKEATWNFITRSVPLNDTRGDTSTSVTLNEVKGPVKSCNATKLPFIARIVTSDISERAVNIIKHNIDCCPLASIAPNGSTPTIAPQLRDFFSYTAKEIADICGDSSPIIVLNPPYGKRLDFDAPKLYTKIGQKLTELARDLHHFGKDLTIAILAPKDDTRNGARYTCTANLLRECPALSSENNSAAKLIVTSHGGLTLNTLIAKI